jgi:hypothetical protein
VVDAEFGLQRIKGDPRYPSVEAFVNYEDDAVVECSTKGVVFGPTCRVWMNVDNKVTFEIDYLRDELPNWRQINEGVRELLEKFLVTSPHS